MSQPHLSEEQLVELYYEPDTLSQAHLAECQRCADEYQQLRAMLAMVAANEAPIPEREESYGREVYARILPLIEAEQAERASGWFGFLKGWSGNFGAAAAVAMLVAVAFIGGRVWEQHRAPKPDVTAKAPVQERVLLVALGDHLDRSQMVLMELTHAQTDPTERGKRALADISAQQQFAEDLVADNRLYRQTAAQVGEAGVAGVLEDLERLLIEIANSPSKLDQKQLEDLQKRIEKEGIVFKVRVIGSTVREKEKAALSGAALSGSVSGQGKL